MNLLWSCCFDLTCIILVLVRLTSKRHFLHQLSTIESKSCKSFSLFVSSTISSAYSNMLTNCILLLSSSSFISLICSFKSIPMPDSLISVARSLMKKIMWLKCNLPVSHLLGNQNNLFHIHLRLHETEGSSTLQKLPHKSNHLFQFCSICREADSCLLSQMLFKNRQRPRKCSVLEIFCFSK